MTFNANTQQSMYVDNARLSEIRGQIDAERLADEVSGSQRGEALRRAGQWLTAALRAFRPHNQQAQTSQPGMSRVETLSANVH